MIHSSNKENYSPTAYNKDEVYVILYDLKLLIHFIAQFSRLVQWKKTNKYSLLLFLCWIIWWKIHKFILSILPMILIIGINIYQPNIATTTHHNQKQQLLKDLTEIRDTINFISLIKWMQKSDTLCRAYYTHYSIATKKRRLIIFYCVAFLFTLIYAGWIILFYQQIVTSCASIAWFSILVIMCLHCPWVNSIYAAGVCAVMPITYYFNKVQQDSSTTAVAEEVEEKKQHQQNGYLFEIYHHQRWWFPTGWSNLLLPQDRPVWSDIYLESTPSIDEFKLPPTSYIGKPNEFNRQKIVSWTWIDSCWSKQQEQYGNWKWSLQSSGLGICTRRQKWFRYAQRKESWVSIITEVDDSCSSNSLIGGSEASVASSLSSTYNRNRCWDDDSSSSSSSNSTTASAENLLLRPTLISNVNEIRRYSSHSVVTFNTPILSHQHIIEDNNLYKQFFISPKPKKLKRHGII